MKNRLRGLGNKKQIEIAVMTEVVGGEVMRIHEIFNNVDYFLSVEGSYWNPSEGKGANDAVLFQTGQVAEGKEEIDSCVAVSVEDARAFANSILQTCDEIERAEPQEEPKCTISTYEKEHLPGAYITKISTSLYKRIIHHYSAWSRDEYVNEYIRQLELAGISYVVNKSKGENKMNELEDHTKGTEITTTLIVDVADSTAEHVGRVRVENGGYSYTFPVVGDSQADLLRQGDLIKMVSSFFIRNFENHIHLENFYPLYNQLKMALVDHEIMAIEEGFDRVNDVTTQLGELLQPILDESEGE